MYIEDKLKMWAFGLTFVSSFIFGGGFYVAKSIDCGEWNLKKQNAIYYEFNNFSENKIPNKKDYFNWASKTLKFDEIRDYDTQIAEIRAELKKSSHKPLSIQDFKNYLENHKKN